LRKTYNEAVIACISMDNQIEECGARPPLPEAVREKRGDACSVRACAEN